MKSNKTDIGLISFSVIGFFLFFSLIIVAINPYIKPLGWGYERGKELARESYAMARYKNSQGHLFTGFYYSFLGIRTSIDSEFDYVRALPLLKKVEILNREGKTSEAKVVCREAEKVLIEYLWENGIRSICTY